MGHLDQACVATYRAPPMISRTPRAHWLHRLAASLCLLGFLCSGNIVPGIAVLLATANGEHTVRVSHDRDSVSIVLAHDHGHHHSDSESHAADGDTPTFADRDADSGHADHVIQFVSPNQYAASLLSQLQRTATTDALALPVAIAAPLTLWPHDSHAHAARPPPLLSAALLSHRTIVLVI
ncbi:hypothetical protein BH20VER3_BH20VER3_16650 [soil metagenome]